MRAPFLPKTKLMEYTMSTSSVKGKDEIKMTMKPVTNLEREFFANMFRGGGTPSLEMTAGGDEVLIILKEKQPVNEDICKEETK